MTRPCGKTKRSNVVANAEPIRGWADEIGPLLSVSGFPSSPEMPLAFLPRLGFGPPPSAADGLQRDPPNPSERHRLGYGRPETDAGGPIMFTQPQQNPQPSIPTNLPAPLPPGPVPAPAPRQAGDIPVPPLNSAGSSKKPRAQKPKLTKEDRVLLRAVVQQFHSAQRDRATVVTSYLCHGCNSWHKDQSCRLGLCSTCSARLSDLIVRLGN
jgi:hypothetical protein